MTQNRFEKILSDLDIDNDDIADILDDLSMPWREKKQAALQSLQTVLLNQLQEIEQVIREIDKSLK